MRHPSLFIALVFCLVASSLYAQRYILLDDAFLKNAEHYPVKRKGISTIGKYEFGPFRIVSGKAGWEKTTRKSAFFATEGTIESSQKMSFILVKDDKDTVKVNIATRSFSQIDQANWFFQNILQSDETWITSETDVFEAEFTISADSMDWNLVITDVYREGMGIDDEVEAFRGYLSDGNTTIVIKPVFEDQKGKRSLINPVAGYEFFFEESAVGAVQVMPLNQLHVWFKSELNDRFQLVVAGCMAALLVRTM